MMAIDVAIVGGGIVGLATAMSLLASRPGIEVAVLEKESSVGRHQTGHNSGVIHTGIYYAPGSLKALLCREGCTATKVFCDEAKIPYSTCGKILVACTPREMARLDALFDRSRINGVRVERLAPDELADREPNVAGLSALFVPDAAIVDYRAICEAMAARIREAGGTVRTGSAVRAIREGSNDVEIEIDKETLHAKKLVACAGLQADRVARMAGLKSDYRIVPVRGEYFRLRDAKRDFVRHLIYPVPDPDLPFLGIHITPTIDGNITVGPNAVFGLSREGYGKFSFNLRDTAEALVFPGTWRLLARYWRSAAAEARNSLQRRVYLDACRKYCPSLTLADLRPHPAGIRAQAIGRDGRLVHDFVFAGTERMLHVLNAPSPAATSALPIGRMSGDKLFGGTG
jgi:L-2-hydroxyglutarate oxidase